MAGQDDFAVNANLVLMEDFAKMVVRLKEKDIGKGKNKISFTLFLNVYHLFMYLITFLRL